jgi:hypothetical protein
MSKIKFIIGTFLCLSIYSLSFAQVLDDFDDSPAAKVEQAREQFITEKLNLSNQEADAFWKVYYEYKDKEEKIKNNYRPAKGLRNMSDEDAHTFVLSRFEMDSKLLQLKKDYYQEFQKIIGSKRVIQYTRAEKAFRQEVLRRFKENRKRKLKRQGRNE